MKKWWVRAAAIVAVTAITASAGLAQKKDSKKPAPAAPKCDVCKMDLTTKKDKEHSVAVKIKGKTYYCCAGCDMNKKKK